MKTPQPDDLAVSRLLLRTVELPGFHAPPRTAEVRLHLNEPGYPPSPGVIAALRNAEGAIARYPDGSVSELREALAARLGADSARIVIGAGSDDLIGLLASAFLSPGDRCVLPVPSFPRYRTCALLQRASALAIPVDARGTLDVGAIIKASRGATMVFASTPNNPTGGMLDRAALAALAEGIDEQALLVLDEAYFEFARAAGGPDGLTALAARRGPWVLLRTFSKAYSLAGLRVGYGLCSHVALAEALNRCRSVFNVSALAQAAAIAALQDDAYARAQVDLAVAARERLRRQLADIGIPCLPSAANFLAARLPVPATAAIAALAAQGILVSSVGPPPFERHIRITIGSQADHARLLESLTKIAGV